MKKTFKNLPLDKIPKDERLVGEPADKKHVKTKTEEFRKLFDRMMKSEK